MIKPPGAYIVGYCYEDSCPVNNTELFFYLGIGKFDLWAMTGYLQCVACSSAVSCISDLAFSKCK